MRKCVFLLAVAGLALGFAPAPLPKPAELDPGKADLRQLQGEWHEPEGVAWAIAGARLRVLIDGRTVSEWGITLDARKKPKHFDLKWLAGAGNELVPRGIYRVEGDTFTVCFDDNRRPADFKRSTPGVVLRTYTRKR